MLEHAYYSVIAPESGASILFRDPAKAPDMAVNLKITADDALRLGVIEEIVPEPLGGAHRNFPQMCQTLGATIERHFDELAQLPPDELLEMRYARFRKLGQLEDNGAPQCADEIASDDAALDGEAAATSEAGGVSS
jgi:acetyl-CoA carboxylase carboxyl transferase subunit alpha